MASSTRWSVPAAAIVFAPNLFATCTRQLPNPPAAHDQRPVAGLEVGEVALTESQREMPRDDRRMSEGEPLRKRHAVDVGDPQELRVFNPALDPKHISIHTTAMYT